MDGTGRKKIEKRIKDGSINGQMFTEWEHCARVFSALGIFELFNR